MCLVIPPPCIFFSSFCDAHTLISLYLFFAHLLFSLCLFLFQLTQSQVTGVACKFLVILLHYFRLTNFFWMLVEGMYVRAVFLLQKFPHHSHTIIHFIREKRRAMPTAPTITESHCYFFAFICAYAVMKKKPHGIYWIYQGKHPEQLNAFRTRNTNLWTSFIFFALLLLPLSKISGKKMNIFALLVNPPNKRTIYSVGIRIIICILHRLSNHIQLAEKWKLWNYMTYVRFRNAFYYALCLTSLFILFAGLYLYMLVVQTFSGDDIKFKMYAFIGWGMCSDVLSFSLTFWRLAIYSIYSPLWTFERKYEFRATFSPESCYTYHFLLCHQTEVIYVDDAFEQYFF